MPAMACLASLTAGRSERGLLSSVDAQPRCIQARSKRCSSSNSMKIDDKGGGAFLPLRDKNEGEKGKTPACDHGLLREC